MISLHTDCLAFYFLKKERDAMTQPKTDLAYLRSEKAKAERKLRSCQHREKILERQMSELNRRERVHRLCTLSLIHISEPTRRTPISYAVFCLKKKKKPFSNASTKCKYSPQL